MKITNIRMLRLWGPRHHGVGGGETKIYKVVVRVDTDAGVYGLGEADDFMGVRQGTEYAHHYFQGRDPFEAVPLIQEFMWATLPPHRPDSAHGTRGNQIMMVPSSAPTAVPW